MALTASMAYIFPAYGEEAGDTVVTQLEEVSITMVKQSAALGRQPEASTIISGKELEQIGAHSLHGISDVVPNFYMPDYGSRITSTIYVRGIGARMDQPSVGLNIDNVPYLNKDAYDFDIADISKVEMLRGPQSTLYGRNTMAGVINITTLSPLSFNGWRLMAEGGSAGRAKAAIGWYHKFSHNFGLSVNADYYHSAGYFVNEYNGEKTDKENSWGARLKLQWRPSRDWMLMNTASAGWLRQGGYPYEYIKSGKIEYNDTCFYRRFTFADGLTASYRGEGFNLTSITSVQHIDDNMTLDQDFLPLDYFTLTQKKKETSFTEEIVVKGEAMEGRYRWINGAFGFYKHLDMDAPVTFKDVGIRELIESHRNESNPSYPIRWDTRIFALNSNFTIPTTGAAIYHQSEFSLGNWTLTAGLRLDYENTRLNYRSFCNTGYEIVHLTHIGEEPYSHISIDIDDSGKLRKDFVTLLPKIAVLYSFPDNLGNIYGKVSKGYKAGGFNTQMFSDVLQQRLMGIMGLGGKYDVDDIVSYKPEQSWNYEIGSHLDLLSRKIYIELAGFYIDCRDQQLTTFPDGNTTGRIMTNAGKTRSFGGEISIGYSPLKSLNFNVGYGYTNARFKEYFNGISNFRGKYLPYVPANTLFIQGLYALNLRKEGDKSIIFDVNLRGAGPIYWNEENSIRQNFYSLLGASATLKINNIEIQIWGKNLTNTRYYTFYFMSMGNEFLQRGIGITTGVSLRFSV